MSIFHRAMDRLADFLWTGRKVSLRITAESRTACYAAPLIAKLLAKGDDGDAYRNALVPWHEAERPPDRHLSGLYIPLPDRRAVAVGGP